MTANRAAAVLPADATPLLEGLPEAVELLPDEPVVPLEEPEVLPEELLPLVLLLLLDVATSGDDATAAPVALSTEMLPQPTKLTQTAAAAAMSSGEDQASSMRAGLTSFDLEAAQIRLKRPHRNLSPSGDLSLNASK